MIPLLARRQERAFERLYRKHVGDVYRHALAVRAVLVMREVEGRSYAEMAQILAFSVAAVEALIFHARQALREELEGSLACHEAELAVSQQLDHRLARKEKCRLRAHLRSCAECPAFARSQRAQRAALRALAAVPLPDTLQSFFGSGPRRLALRGGRKFSRSGVPIVSGQPGRTSALPRAPPRTRAALVASPNLVRRGHTRVA